MTKECPYRFRMNISECIGDKCVCYEVTEELLWDKYIIVTAQCTALMCVLNKIKIGPKKNGDYPTRREL
jgi:hypothetical protein